MSENAAEHSAPHEHVLLAAARKLWSAAPPEHSNEYWEAECERLQRELAEAWKWKEQRWIEERNLDFERQVAQATAFNDLIRPNIERLTVQLVIAKRLLNRTDDHETRVALEELAADLTGQLETDGTLQLVAPPKKKSIKDFGEDLLTKLGRKLRHAERQLRDNREAYAAYELAQANIARVQAALAANPNS